MPDTSRKRILRTSIIYWMLLFYIIAALIWWFISLNKQNTMMRDFQIKNLPSKVDSVQSTALYQENIQKFNNQYERNKSKYIGEGSIFFLLILVGAGFVYQSIKRQLNIQHQQQNFMMAVTHELKTPISIVKLNLETLQKYNLEQDKQKKLIKTTIDETSRLNFLTTNILIASQLEGGGYQFSKEDLDLSTLLKDCLQDFRNRFPEKVLYDQIETDADIKGDALLLQMMINNLLENAIKYSPKEGRITAILKKQNHKIELQIKDEGPGIAPEEKKLIFNKFYRIGNEATRKTQGTGLGLYLCRKIAQDHNADISVTDNNPHGSNFVITFYS